MQNNMPIKGNIIERLLRSGAITSDEAKELLNNDRHEPFEIYEKVNRDIVDRKPLSSQQFILNHNHYLTEKPIDIFSNIIEPIEKLIKPE